MEECMTINTRPIDMTELRQVVCEVLELDEAEVTDDAHFVDDLGVNSLMALEVMVVLEKRYHVRIAEDELKEMTSVCRVHDLLASKLSDQP
jgi:acyl carrier protein